MQNIFRRAEGQSEGKEEKDAKGRNPKGNSPFWEFLKPFSGNSSGTFLILKLPYYNKNTVKF